MLPITINRDYRCPVHVGKVQKAGVDERDGLYSTTSKAVPSVLQSSLGRSETRDRISAVKRSRWTCLTAQVLDGMPGDALKRRREQRIPRELRESKCAHSPRQLAQDAACAQSNHKWALYNLYGCSQAARTKRS